MRGKLEFDLDPPTSKACVLIITCNCLVQGQHFKAGGPITGEMLEGFFSFFKEMISSLSSVSRKCSSYRCTYM